MSTNNLHPSVRIDRSRALWLLVVPVLLALAFAVHGPIVQWAGYHDFADARSWFGLPNAENVLSNLPFLVVGCWGLWLHLRSAGADRHAWRAFSVALICTAFGSALYHWAPDNGRLVFDRLPIAWACAALTFTLLAERVDLRWSRLQMLVAGLTAATGSVVWWWLGDRTGTGDLRPYLFVQFLPMLLVPMVLWLKLPAQHAHALRTTDWLAVLGLYAAAKLMEVADTTVLDALAFTSGHTLKHLLAAAAAFHLLRASARGGPTPRSFSFDSRR